MDRDRLRTPSIHLLPNCSPTANTTTSNNEPSYYYRPSSSRSNSNYSNMSSSNHIDNLAQHMASLRMVSSSSNYSTYSTPSTTTSLSTPDLDTSFITTSRGGHSSLNPPSPTYFPTRHIPVYHDPEQESYSKRERVRESSVGIRSCHPSTNKCVLPVCPECGVFVKHRVRDFKDGIWYWYWCCGGVGSGKSNSGGGGQGQSQRNGCGKVFWFPGKAEVKKV